MEKYQTFWRRFWAGIIDGMIFMPLQLVDGYFSAEERGPFVVISWAAAIYTACWLYSVLFHARRGQTLGKMVTRIKVFDVSEQRIPTLRQAFLRDIGYIVLNTISLGYLIHLVLAGRFAQMVETTSFPGLIITLAGCAWFLLEIISMVTNQKRRAFHDFIAGTVVVRLDSLATSLPQSTPEEPSSRLSRPHP